MGKGGLGVGWDVNVHVYAHTHLTLLYKIFYGTCTRTWRYVRTWGGVAGARNSWAKKSPRVFTGGATLLKQQITGSVRFHPKWQKLPARLEANTGPADKFAIKKKGKNKELNQRDLEVNQQTINMLTITNSGTSKAICVGHGPQKKVVPHLVWL